MQTLSDIFNDVPEQVEQPQQEEVKQVDPPQVQETGVKVEEVPPTPENQQERMVPLKAMEDYRRKWQETEARLKEIEARSSQPEPKKTPDVFEDPEGYTNHMQEVLQQATMTERFSMSRFLAQREHPDLDAKLEVFGNLVKENPQFAAQIQQSPSPYHTMVEIVNKHEKMQKFENLDKYEAELKAKFRAEFEAELQAKALAEAEKSAKKDAAITPNLNKARAAAAIDHEADDSLEALLKR